MRIIGLKEFLTLPEGTIYQKYRDNNFDRLSMKLDTYPEKGCNDFLLIPLTNEVDCESPDHFDEITGKALKDSSYNIPLTTNEVLRDGLFEMGQLYAIYDKSEVKDIIKKLQESTGE